MNESQSFNNALKRIGIKNVKTFYMMALKGKIQELDIDLSQMRKNFEDWKRKTDSSKRKDASKVFCKNSSYNRANLKNRIIKDGLIEYKCECGITEKWQGKRLVLQIDHINGVNNDNRLENLRFLCPNCHSQTEDYAGKNR